MSLQPSILIVDDHEPSLLAMGEYFRYRGFAVDYSRDLREAERLLATNRYGVVITDLHLAGINDRQGLDLISYARGRWPSVCTILLTADESPQVEAEARQRGVDAFLCKPKPLSEVEETVCSLLALRQENH